MPLASIESPIGPGAVAEIVTAPFEVTIERRHEEVVLRVAGELDLATIDLLRDPLLELADRPPGEVVVDLAGCRFIDSTAISTLVRCQRSLQVSGRAGTRLMVCGAGGQVRRLFELTGLDRVVCVVD